MNQTQIEITALNVKHKHGVHIASYDYVVMDALGAKRAGNGSVAVSNPEAIEAQISNNLRTKLGYGSFDVHFPPKPVVEAPKRSVLAART